MFLGGSRSKAGLAGVQLVEELRYKPEDRGFDSRGVFGIFH